MSNHETTETLAAKVDANAKAMRALDAAREAGAPADEVLALQAAATEARSVSERARNAYYGY